VSKLGIPYENRGLITLCINDAMITTMDGIRPLPKVEAVDTIVARTCKGELGSGTPPVVAIVEGVCGLPDELATFASITACRII
jgi:hypothetical protein